MEKNELKFIWNEIKISGNEANIEKIIQKEHSEIISKVMYTQKLKIGIYAFILGIYICLMIYAFVYLRLSLSLNLIMPLSFAGLFLFIKPISEFNWLRLLKNRSDEGSIKESLFHFKKKLNLINTIDFISSLIYCYIWAIGLIFIILNDINTIENQLPFVISLIIVFILSPWILKYQYKKRNKNLYSNLNHSIDSLK